MPGDEFADEPAAAADNDGRRQHKYSTADMKPEYPWKRWLCTCFVCLLVIAIMIFISILFQKLFDPSEDEDWDDSSDNNATLYDDDLALGETGAAPLLPKSMQYVEDACHEERLDNAQERKECEELCEPANECCDPFASGNSTCFSEQESGCFTYAKCHSLNGFIDPAHTDLDRICAKAALEVNRDECVLACESVACCWTATESCLSTNFQACMDYAACQNLNEEVNTIDVAPTDLAERCERKSPTCERDCREALCCSDPNSRCYRENFVACLSYASCTGNSDTKVLVAPMYSRVDPAIENFDRICSRSKLEQDGPEECLVACEASRCCWEEGATGCFGDDPLGCLEYQRCKLLLEPKYANATLPPSYTPAPAPGGAAGGAATEEEGSTTAPSAASTNVTQEVVTATVSRTSAPSIAPAGNSTAGPSEEEEMTSSPNSTVTEPAATIQPTTEVQREDETAG